MEPTDDAGPEFSRVVRLDDLGKEDTTLDLVASAEERTALARRFGISDISDLRALGGLTRLDSGRVRLRVTLEAEVSQICVVSLDPVINRIEEDIDILFEPARRDKATPDIAFDPDSDNEPLIGDSLDVGEIVAEELALSLDPYPRKPGIAPGIGPGGEAGEQPRGGPFEALAALKRKE